MENFHINYYDMEQVIVSHTNMFQDYTYSWNNLLKQKEKLFTRGKPHEWQMKETNQDPEFFNKLMQNKKSAFDHMLHQVS
jgi:hypothetical protein